MTQERVARLEESFVTCGEVAQPGGVGLQYLIKDLAKAGNS